MEVEEFMNSKQWDIRHVFLTGDIEALNLLQ